MTKARTKAGARRKQREQQERAPDAPIRPKSPRAAERAAAQERAIETRARIAGVWPPDVTRAPGETAESFATRQEARRAQVRAAAEWLKAPWHGCNGGRALAGEPDVEDLWDALSTIRARRAAFLRAIDAPRDVSAMSLMVAPDEETEGAAVSAVTDIRSDEEKAEAARAAWDRTAATIDAIGPGVLGSILAVVERDVPLASPDAPSVPVQVTDWLKTAPQAALVLLRDMVVAAIVERAREGRPVTFPLASALRQYRLFDEFEAAHRRLPADLKEAREWLKGRQSGEAA